MTTLYDQFGRPVRGSKTPERRPLAAAPLMDAWRDYVASGLTPSSLAAMLREADAGDVRRQSELFDQIEERDGHLIGEKTKRANVILDVDFELRPTLDDDPREAKIIEFLEAHLTRRTEFADVLVSLQDAVGKGFAAIELGWDVSSGQALPDRFDFIEQKRFLFTDAAGVLSQTPRLLTDTDLMGVDIPAWKLMMHRYGGKSGHPARTGLHRVCAWWYLFKNYAVKDWVIFCEVYGMPLRLGKYDPGASSDDKSALLTAISSLGTDAAGIISKATEIEFVESAKGKSSGDLYESLAMFANKEISKALLGQTLTAEVGDRGSYAAAQTHNEVRLDLVLADARALAATVRHQLIRPMVGFNFGWDAPVPLYEPVWGEEEDYGAKAEWVGKLIDRGMDIPVSWMREAFNIPAPEEGEAVLGRGAQPAAAPRPAMPAKIAAKASPRPDLGEGDTLDRIGERAMAESDFTGLWAPVESALREADSLEAFRSRLDGIAQRMDPSKAAETLARALAVAELYGRFDVKGGR